MHNYESLTARLTSIKNWIIGKTLHLDRLPNETIAKVKLPYRTPKLLANNSNEYGLL